MPRRNRGRWWSRWALVVAIAMSATLVQPGTAEADDSDVEFWLTILHNNDGESEVIPAEVLDENGEVIGTEGGVAYFASVLREARRDANIRPRGDRTKRGSILVSSGDNFLASPSFSASEANGVFYDALALDALRYNAIILGNHDFDFGPELLADFISEGFRRPGKPPYLSANLDFSGEPTLQALVDNRVIAARTVVRVRGEKIGIVGATTENLPFISSPRDVVVNAVLPAAQAEIDALEAAGIDKIIFVSHLQDVEGDIELAESLSGVDVMVAGGGDELLANLDDPLLPSDQEDCLPDTDDDAATCNPDGVPDAIFGAYPLSATNADGMDVPVVTTSGQYGYLGNLVVGFDDEGNVVAIDDDASGPLRVVSQSIGPDGVRPDRALNRRVVAPVEAFVADLAALVIGTSEVDLDGVRDNVRSVETNEGNLIADSQLWQAQQVAADFDVDAPQVALQNGGGIRNDSVIPAGDITELDTFDMVPFPNFVTVVPDIPRAQFKEILENAVSRAVDGDTPGGTGRFAQVAGFSFVWDAAGTAQELDEDGNVVVAGTRVQTVTLDGGTPIVTAGVVVDGDPIDIAIVDFLARGGDQYPFRDAPFTAVGVSYQQALSNYIQGPLAGNISSTDYPEGGEGRVTRLN
ncbi:MAG: 5'-nucleotidase C-terminal domain-containing protein [Acidimicrobiia bacterium]|nr:5'-nucleotidase C-terminal domain-containing protein [Acidimicrobiia bacterium]